MDVMKLAAVGLIMAVLAVALTGVNCQSRKPDDLDKLGAIRLTIKGQAFQLWIADSPSEQGQGLMFVTAERMTPLPDGAERGMIFVFDHEQHLYFWMKNTVIPLDIAYINAAGQVVGIHTMAPLDMRPGQYPSGAPARYAIEVNAGVFGRIGLTAGDTVELPAAILKRNP